MDGYIITNASEFITGQERTRLVGLCARLTGNHEVAEDLAQETLLEAWRHLENLREPDKRAQWLNGIARNVCLRWGRKQGQDRTHLTSLDVGRPDDHQEQLSLAETLSTPFDIEIDLEQRELIELLDRALALLPEETRAVLIKRFVDESSLNEIASQLGTNLGTVAMRLQRGKLALHRVLTTSMADELNAYGLTSDQSGQKWDNTRYWCIVCGQHRLIGKLNPQIGYLELRCPVCCPDEKMIFSRSTCINVLKGVRSYKMAIQRIIHWADEFYRNALLAGTTTCINCNHQLVKPVIKTPEQLPRWFFNSTNSHGVELFCTHCQAYCSTLLEGMIYHSAIGQRFHKQHSRIRLLPEQTLECNGRMAALTTFESVTDGARLDVISALDNFEVLQTHITGANLHE